MRAEQRPVALHVTRAQGSRLWDVDGNEYVDYVLGFGAAFLGHAPPAVVAAVAEQARHGFAPGAQHAAEAAVAELVVAVRAERRDGRPDDDRQRGGPRRRAPGAGGHRPPRRS